jgi:hypothetical protein
MTNEVPKTIAISIADAEKWGCPYCGFRSHTTPICGGGTIICNCGECKKTFAVLATGLNKSSIGFGNYYPELQVHPRSGTPSHGRPDNRPKNGGDFFSSRGCGLDCCKCFICGTNDRDGKGHTCLNNISGFVQTKAAGERIVTMFSKGAHLDYREYEPDYIQVKIGACDKHLDNLRLLDYLVRKGVITNGMIIKATPETEAEMRAFKIRMTYLSVREKTQRLLYPIRSKLNRYTFIRTKRNFLRWWKKTMTKQNNDI